MKEHEWFSKFATNQTWKNAVCLCTHNLLLTNFTHSEVRGVPLFKVAYVQPDCVLRALEQFSRLAK